MPLDTNIVGASSGTGADVNTDRELKVTLNTDATKIGGVRFFSENDSGSITGVVYNASPETDDDARLRIGHEVLFDNETFNYTAQNTGKHIYRNTTMTFAWNASGLTTNSGNITTTTTGASLQSYAFYPVLGANHLYVEFECGFTAQPTSNTQIDFGVFIPNTTNPFAPTDGAYFRLTASGMQGVINSNGTETTTGVLNFTYANNQKYQYIISITERTVEFWINNVLYGEIATPAGQGQPFMSAALPVALRHAIAGGAAGAALSMIVNDITVTVGGTNYADDLGSVMSRALGSHQGLSGGTMGSLATYANSTNPTSAAGSNTAANVTGLGGQGAINAAASAATDFIMTSYQVPAGSVSVQGRRLRVNGVHISAANLGAAVATTATTIALSLAWGHTAVSLATTEAATTKAPRREALGMMFWNVGAVVGATPQNGDIYMPFTSPIYVNPGEFIATVMKFLVGTATASQSIWYHVTFDYSWE